MISNRATTHGEPTSGQPKPRDEVSVLSTTGLPGPAEIASVRPARFRRDLASQRAATAADPVRWHHDLAAEPALTAGQAAALLAVDEDQAGRILGWLRSRGRLLAVRRPDGLAYLRFQFDPVGRGVHRVVALVNIWLGAGTDPYTVAAWWLRPRVDGRRACDLVGTLDEDLILSSPPPTSTGRCSPSACNPKRTPAAAADSSRPTLFLDDGEPAALPPQRPPVGSGMWWRRRRTDHGAPRPRHGHGATSTPPRHQPGRAQARSADAAPGRPPGHRAGRPHPDCSGDEAPRPVSVAPPVAGALSPRPAPVIKCPGASATR